LEQSRWGKINRTVSRGESWEKKNTSKREGAKTGKRPRFQIHAKTNQKRETGVEKTERHFRQSWV